MYLGMFGDLACSAQTKRKLIKNLMEVGYASKVIRNDI